MKNILVVFAIAMLGSVNAFAQKIADDIVPATVTKAFSAKFPKATAVSWEKETATEYEANFKTGKAETSAKFDKDGKWLETETEIEVAGLPAGITKTLAANYTGYKVKEAEKAETFDKGLLYELEITKGAETLEIRLLADGKVVSSKKEGKD